MRNPINPLRIKFSKRNSWLVAAVLIVVFGGLYFYYVEVPTVLAQTAVKKAAIFTYKSQLDDPWLNGLLLSSIRRNELLAIPKTLNAR